MSIRNWLIRTRNNKILGPTSKDKVIELIKNGSLHQDDQVSSGNGYWFWIKEEDLVNKYIFGDIKQSFNPVSEAKSPVVDNRAPLPSPPLPSPRKGEAHVEPETQEIPCEEDLEFPDVDNRNEDKLQEEIIPQEKEAAEETKPLIESTIEERDNRDSSAESGEIENKDLNSGEVSRRKKNDRYLFAIILILLVMIVFVIRLYYKLFNNPFPELSFISNAHAQSFEQGNLSKKKTYLA